MVISIFGCIIELLPIARVSYTFGPPLRIANIKNMGKDLAPEKLRICPCDRPMATMGHRNQRKIWIFRCINVKILKKSRAARAKDYLDHQYRG